MKRRLHNYLILYRTILRRGSFRQWRHLIQGEFRALFQGKALPRQAVIALTNRCQCHCAHCCMGKYDVSPSGELSAEEVSGLLREMSRMGVSFITWFGGEPLLRDDLIRFVAEASSLGMFSTVETNGIAVDERILDGLRSAGLSRLCVSLDSADESVHDASRDCQGSFKAACRAVRVASGAGIPCTVSVTVRRDLMLNGDLGRLVMLSKDLGAAAVRLIPPVSTGNWAMNEEVRLGQADREFLWSINQPGFTYIEHILNSNESLFYCDAAHLKKIYISCTGEVHPCEFVPISFGNIREESIRDILERMRNYPDLGIDCGDCITHCDHTRGLICRQMEQGGKFPVIIRNGDKTGTGS